MPLPTITIYTKKNCIQCTMSKKILDTHKATYTSIDIEQNPDALTYLKTLGYLAAPVITVTAEDTALIDHWAGFNPERLKKYIAQQQDGPRNPGNHAA